MGVIGQTFLLRQVLLGGQAPVAFVGSGLSRRGSWEMFLLALAERADHRKGQKYLRRAIDTKSGQLDEMLALADEFIVKIGEEHVPRFVIDYFTRRIAEPFSESLTALVRAPFAFYVTTNYDTEIEDAYFAQHGIRLDSATLNNQSKIILLLERNTPFVLKLHGCTTAGEGFVIGAKHYQDIVFGRPEARAILQLVLGSRPMVFLGYGHRDPNINSYLDYQRQRLGHAGLRRIAFVRQDGTIPFDLAAYYKARFGIDSVIMDKWSELASQLNQCAYLHGRDKYLRVRLNKRERFRAFLADRHPTDAWDAILFAAASSDLGYTEELAELYKAVKGSDVRQAAIQKDKALNIIYHIAIGQMLKRTGKRREAARVFCSLVGLVEKSTNEEVVAPIRSTALRYAGIYWFVEEGNIKKGRRLLKLALDVFGQPVAQEFAEERLDARKWVAIAGGRTGDTEAAIAELEKIVEEATLLGYFKNAAWARLNLAEMLVKAAQPASDDIAAAENHLHEALDSFSELGHLRGEAAARLSLARLPSRSGAARRRSRKDLQMNLDRVQHIATITGDARLAKAART